MALTAGVLSQLAVSSTTAKLASTAASGGTGPYTQQWYRDTVSGFTPGVGNLIAGATALSLDDSGLIPNTSYFYKVVYTDTFDASTVTSLQLAVASAAPTLNPNQFAQKEYLGVLDLRLNMNTISVQIDLAQSGALYGGQAVKLVDSVGGVPKVVAVVDADPGELVYGFLNYDPKTIAFVAGAYAEMSMAGNAMYLYATAAISRGALVQLDFATVGGVKTAAASLQFAAGAAQNVVGWAIDKATAPGQLVRVMLMTPSFIYAA